MGADVLTSQDRIAVGVHDHETGGSRGVLIGFAGTAEPQRPQTTRQRFDVGWGAGNTPPSCL